MKSGKNIAYLKGQTLGGAGQVQINNVCVDNLQIKFSTDGPFKIDPNSKTKTNQGINFSEPNSTNILLSVNVQDSERQKEKVDAVWGFLSGDKTNSFTGELDEGLLTKIFPNVEPARAKDILPFINTYLTEFKMTTCEERIMFFTQIAEETDNLGLLTEVASDWSSSTSKYKGRGLFQLTGSSNYRRFEAYCKELGDDVDFINKPETINNPKYAVLSAFWYWDINNCKKYSRVLSEDNMLKIAKITNCGSISSNCSHNEEEEPCNSCKPNGWARRKLEFERLQKLFPCN